MQLRFRFPLSLLFVAAAVVACKSRAPAPATDEHAGHGHGEHHEVGEPSPIEPGPAGPRLETSSFLLEVVPAASGYSVGKVGEVAIALEGRGDWHVNQDYPIRVELEAEPEVGLRREALVKEDAEEFGEDKVRFLADLKPAQAGEHDVRCDVSFAMCTDENCVLERRTVAMQVKVE